MIFIISTANQTLKASPVCYRAEYLLKEIFLCLFKMEFSMKDRI